MTEREQALVTYAAEHSMEQIHGDIAALTAELQQAREEREAASVYLLGVETRLSEETSRADRLKLLVDEQAFYNAGLVAERDAEKQRADRLQRDCLRYESEIAAVCDEDYSLQETFDSISRQMDCIIGERDRLAAELAQVREALRAVEWRGAGEASCPVCLCPKSQGHTPGCIVGQAMEGKA